MRIACFCVVGYVLVTMALTYSLVWRHDDTGYTWLDKWVSILLSPLVLPKYVFEIFIYEPIICRVFPKPETEILVAVPVRMADEYAPAIQRLLQSFAEEIGGLTLYDDNDCRCVRFTLPHPEKEIAGKLRQVLPADLQAMLQINKRPFHQLSRDI